MSGVVYGSVCSGIEAATTAWHPLGWRPSFFSEIEAFPRAVLKHHWPEVPLHGDFTTIKAGDYEPIDLLVGGTPCQSFSVAGLRGGLDDERGNLALEYLRLAQRLRPRWLVWENVPGVLSSNGGRDFGAILGGMVELGYGFAYRVLDAQFFGLAQRRRRVFVVGHLGDWRRAAAVLFERHGLQGHPAPSREAAQRPAGTLAGGARSGGGYSEDDIPHVAHTLNAKGGAGRIDGESETFVAHALRAKHNLAHRADADTLIAHTLKGEGFDASEDGTGRGTPIVPVCFSSKDHGADAETDLSPTLRAGSHDGSHANAGVPPAIAFGWQNSPSQGDSASVHITPTSDKSKTPAVAFNITPSNSNKHYNARATDRAQSVTAGGNRPSARGGDLIAFDTTQVTSVANRSSPQAGDPCHPLAAGAHAPAIAGSAVRRLTPRECERLQGFPDDYTLIPYGKRSGDAEKAELAAYFERTGQYLNEVAPDQWVFDRAKFEADWPRMAADGPRYKALGNSMAVPCMAWIGQRIAMIDALNLREERAA